ncbi:hypothetical protein AVEN_66268-1 [Araneus ventricosus]|uniref:Uncharacterized protein n=1 Tax=Araneus ventricosus TaxID=182803 RepID=A0A4Y2TQF3_ARAVE|nr:hypothetical protein AVEN_66268-1 [Araneus ventricosus]
MTASKPATHCPIFDTTLTSTRLKSDVRLNVHKAYILGGVSVELNLKLVILRSRIRGLITRQPRLEMSLGFKIRIYRSVDRYQGRSATNPGGGVVLGDLVFYQSDVTGRHVHFGVEFRK